MASKEGRRLVRAIAVLAAFFAFMRFAQTDTFEQMMKSVTDKIFVEPLQRDEAPDPTPTSN